MTESTDAPSKDRPLTTASRLVFWTVVASGIGIMLWAGFDPTTLAWRKLEKDGISVFLRANQTKAELESMLGIKLRPAQHREFYRWVWPSVNTTAPEYEFDDPLRTRQYHVVVYQWQNGTSRVEESCELNRDAQGNLLDQSDRIIPGQSRPRIVWSASAIFLRVCSVTSLLLPFGIGAWLATVIMAVGGTRRKMWRELALGLVLFSGAAAFQGLLFDANPALPMAVLYACLPGTIVLFILAGFRRGAQAELVVEPKGEDHLLSGGQPDWAAIPESTAVHCPLCGYNLRGLQRPQCPECGLEFQWQALFDAARNRHPWLHEHRVGIALGAMSRTFRAGLNPQRFWRQITPLHAVRPFRLAAYFLVVVLLTLLPLVALWIAPDAGPPSRISWTVPEVDWLFLNIIRGALHENSRRFVYGWSFCFGAWPLITLAVLFVFQHTLRRAAARPGHVVRVVVYCADLISFAAVLMLPAVLMVLAAPEYEGAAAAVVKLLTLVMCPLLVHRLAVACRLYLRIAQAAAASLITQFIFLLIVLIVCVVSWQP